MKRGLSLLLAFMLAASTTLGGCGRVGLPGLKKPQTPFTTEYVLDETNIDYFLSNDDLESAMTGGPFYAGAQALPSQNTAEYDKARAAKVAEVNAKAAELVAACEPAKPALANLRSEYTVFLNKVHNEEDGLKDPAIESLNAVALNGTKTTLAELQYAALAGQETTQTYAVAMRDYLAVTKATEYASLMLKDADELASYSAIMITALADSENPAVKSAVAEYDTKMQTLYPDTLKALEPLAQGVADIDLGMRQLSSADHYFSLEAMGYMKAEQAKLEEALAGLEPREGITAEDVANIKITYEAFKELNASMESHLAAIDTSGMVEVAGVPFHDFGPDKAYAAGDYEPGKNYDAGTEVMRQQADSTPPKKGFFSGAWDTVKSGFGKLKTGVGVGVDAIGLGVRNITSVGAGIYYGNSTKDIVDNIMTNTKEVADNYEKGLSGSSTFTTAGEYVEGVETGAGEAAGGATEWGFEKVFGKGKVSGTAGWAVNGVTKITVGMFTGLAKGIYKVADKKSSTEDVAIGFIEIGLGAVGGSKLIIKASQLPGLLKGGAEGAKAFGKIVTNLVGSAANSSQRKAISKQLADLLIKKGMDPKAAQQILAATIKSEINAAMGQLLKNSRAAMIKKVRDLLASGGTGALTNFKETVKSSLEDLLKKGFSKTFQGYLDAGTTVIGATFTDYVDNLVAAGLTDGVLVDLIKSALAIPPDPAQVNGTWTGSLIITKVDIPKSEKKRAEEAGCERAFKELEGKKQSATFKIKLNDSGSGTANMTLKGGSGNGSATYSDGQITMVVTSQGTRFTLKGTVAFKNEGGMTMSGSWSAPFQGSKIKMAGTFSATK